MPYRTELASKSSPVSSDRTAATVGSERSGVTEPSWPRWWLARALAVAVAAVAAARADEAKAGAALVRARVVTPVTARAPRPAVASRRRGPGAGRDLTWCGWGQRRNWVRSGLVVGAACRPRFGEGVMVRR